MERCLRSVLPLLDAWLIVDTGSGDGTQQFIRDYMAHLPGEVIERPWVNFAHNRTESIQFARERADYLLIIDADEYLDLAADFRIPTLVADAYDFELLSGTVTYYKTQLVKTAVPWHFEGIIHEHIATSAPHTRNRLEGVRTVRVLDGARARDPLTYRKDALLLEASLLEEPANARHMYYLAQSYSDAGELQLAEDRYAKRVVMGGWHEEVWSALYQIARLKQMRNQEWPTVLTAYLAAFSFRPDRAEPLFQVGMYYQARKDYPAAYLFFSHAVQIPCPVADLLFIEREIYNFYLPLEFAVACFYVGRHKEAVDTCNELLADTRLTEEQRNQVTANRQFSLDALAG